MMTGIAALEAIAHWPEAQLSETELSVESPRTIDAPWQMVLLQIVRQLNRTSRREASDTATLQQSAAAKTGKNILVIDDTEMLLIFVADVLATADQNFQVRTTSSGEEGLRLATNERPDLVLLDFSLGDMTGDKVCRALLENPATARIPVLMMSGHLRELARTTEAYKNVVAALPKPFLSGALICAVEKALTAGPLPPAPGTMPQPMITPDTPVPSSAATAHLEADSYILLSTNDDGGTKLSEPSSPPVFPAGETDKGTGARDTPPTSAFLAGSLRAIRSEAIHRPTELSVTLSCKVVALQLTTFFELETATLRPFDRIAVVRMLDREAGKSIPLALGFRLDTISLAHNGTIDTLRLVPMHQPPRQPAPSSSFTVGASDFQSTKVHSPLLLTASTENAMRVQLTATFELFAVELSVGFEVAAVVLKSRETTILVRNDSESPGKSFEIMEAEIAPSSELQSLFVRPIP